MAVCFLNDEKLNKVSNMNGFVNLKLKTSSSFRQANPPLVVDITLTVNCQLSIKTCTFSAQVNQGLL